MKRSTLLGSLTACFCLGLAAPLLAAEAPVTGTVNQPSPGERSASAAKPAEKCLSDLRAFHSQMQKDGYWLGGYGGGDGALDGYGDGYGYPLGGFGFGYGLGSEPAETAAGYVDARLGYEVRLLLTAADILARHGQLQPCEGVLATTRDHYKQYVAEMERAGMPMANVPGWQQQQIAAAQPVTSTTPPFRSDQLLGTDVRNAQFEALGSVDDLVMSPRTGKIAYLVIARGGIFGIGEKYVPIPWEAFKVTPNVTLLVLEATKSTMDAAPQVSSDEFTTLGQQSQKVDTYWKALISSKGNN
jgi:sporulation protein YlmC with PRC-barrel domain